MTQAKIYLTVPFAQKDQAKALGARWDAAQKKWYVPAGKDLGLFAKWPMASTEHLDASIDKPSSRPSISQSPAGKTLKQGLITRPSSNDFVAYSGDEPPWE